MGRRLRRGGRRPALPGDRREVMRRRIAADEIFLWSVDGEAVAMAAHAPWSAAWHV